MNALPEEIQSSVDKLVELVRKYPVNIPIPEVIKLLGVDGNGLRTMLERGTCPFGLGWRKPGKERMGGSIPTATFYFWYMNIKGGVTT